MNAISSLNGAMASAISGIDSSLANLSADTQAVASGGANIGAMVDASQQRLAVEASVKSLAIANQTLGSLIDLFA